MWWLRKKTAKESSLRSGRKLEVVVDEAVDAATIVVSDDPVARTVRVEGLGLVDLDERGEVVAIEVFRVSDALERLESMERESQSEEPERRLDEELRASASRFIEQARKRVRHGAATEPHA